jgi:hypothetical protein
MDRDVEVACARHRTRVDVQVDDGAREEVGRVVEQVIWAAVAATASWVDPDGFRSPGGEVHAWLPGTNRTVCGLSTSRSRLARFPHVDWRDVQSLTGRDADLVSAVCHRCAAGTGQRRDEGPSRPHAPGP